MEGNTEVTEVARRMATTLEPALQAAIKAAIKKDPNDPVGFVGAFLLTERGTDIEGLAYWLVAIGTLTQLADALAAGCDVPQSVESVRRVLRAQLDCVAGTIAHKARMAQAAGCAVLPSAKTPIVDSIDVRVRWLMNMNVARLLAVALSPVLYGGGHTFETVREALNGCIDTVAAGITHGASAASDAIPWTLATAHASAAAHQLIEAALATQKREGGMAGANQLFAIDGVPPELWGVTKGQFVRFVSDARAAHMAGEIKNSNGTDPTAPFYYPPDKFDSLEVAPRA